MLWLLLIPIFLILIKYIIDTQSTIKELKKDRNKYRTIAWKYHINIDTPQKLNWLYKNIKKQLSEIIKDLEDTDFKNYEKDIKSDIINALKNIDTYSDTVENEDMDNLRHYKEDHGKI